MKGLLERWNVTIPPKTFFEVIQSNHISISEVQIEASQITFYASFLKHRNIQSLFPDAKSTPVSLWRFVTVILFHPSRLIAIGLMIGLWLWLSQMTFAITFDGEIALQQPLTAYLKKEVSLPAYRLDKTKLKQELKQAFHDQINWLEIRKKGSKFIVAYTAKETTSLTQFHRRELIAQEDGVIRYFSLKHGEKAVHVNDFVKKGDVLVKNYLITSHGQPSQLYVEGVVYADTFQKVTVRMKTDRMPKALQFFRLLLRARTEVSKDFLEDDRIIDENILHFEKEQGTITMVVLYTCYKDISTPRS